MGRKNKNADQDTVFSNNEDLNSDLKIPQIKVQFRTEAQEKLWNLIDNKEIVFISGPAGTGKSFMTILKALSLYRDDAKYKQIILITPAVEAEEKLGALPGDVEEKLAPYTYSMLYLIEKIIGKKKIEKLVEKGIIKVMALAYLRGVNIDNAIVIADEMQNSTPGQMKTFLTRIGENSKYLVSGDLEQSDRFKDKNISGLNVAIEKLKDIEKIGIFEFSNEDIVRNPIISIILERLKNGNGSEESKKTNGKNINKEKI